MTEPRRRSRNRASLVTIYWRDIPAQVNAARDDKKAQALLPARFQHAIDRAAVVAGKTDTQSYVAEWRQETGSLDDRDLHAQAGAEAERLDQEYPQDRLERLVASGGLTTEGAR